MIRTEGMPARIMGDGLTFDDVLLSPNHSTVHPSQTKIETFLTRDIRLPIPLLSAAMDTVTESRMAIAMAREGGIGIIHKNMSIELQASEVDRVKRSESGMIENPVVVSPGDTIREAMRSMERYSISGVPVVGEDGKLAGILTSRDLRFETNPDRLVSDVMTKEVLITAPIGTSLGDAELILHRNRIEKLPVITEDGRLAGLITFKDINKRREFPHASNNVQTRTVGRVTLVLPPKACATKVFAVDTADEGRVIFGALCSSGVTVRLPALAVKVSL